jgi:hypothetical protein
MSFKLEPGEILKDIFCQTENYEKARNDLPRLSQLQHLDWSSY